MLRPKRMCAWMVALAATAVCAGCESTSTAPTSSMQPLGAPTPSASPGISGPVLSGTVSISGAASIPATTFTVGAQTQRGQLPSTPPPGATCRDYARGFSESAFAAPMLQTSGYHSIYVGVSMASGFRGPGTYDTVHDPALTGSAVEGIGAATSVVYTVFHAGDAGSITLTVNADGSGSMKLSHWDSDEVRQTAGSSQVDIDGVVSWVCRDVVATP